LAVVAFAPPPDDAGGGDLSDERVSEGHVLVVAVFAVAAASWAVLMGVAPLLQVRRMLQRRSSADVSIGYLLILLPGFTLWVAYGVASSDIALVIPNVVAFVVATVTVVGCALRLRSQAAHANRSAIVNRAILRRISCAARILALMVPMTGP